MKLNDMTPAVGSRFVPKRRGRGASSGLGKTGGRGHKGQNSRSGGSVRKGFEGGQMPLQRRLPKFGFKSRKSLVSADVRVTKLDALEGSTVTVEVLRAAGLVGKNVKYVKLFGDGKLKRAYKVCGVSVTKGANAAVNESSGIVEEWN